MRAAANGPTNGEIYKYNINRRLDERGSVVFCPGCARERLRLEISNVLFAGRPAAFGYASIRFPSDYRLYLYALGKASADIGMSYWK